MVGIVAKYTSTQRIFDHYKNIDKYSRKNNKLTQTKYIRLNTNSKYNGHIQEKLLLYSTRIDITSGFLKFLVFRNQVLEPLKNVLEHFLLSRQKFLNVMVAFWSRLIFERILQILGFSKSAARAAQKSPRTPSSISSKIFKYYGRILVGIVAK